MKAHERLEKIRHAKGFIQKLRLADDVFPGTSFDETFRWMAEYWTWINRKDAAARLVVRCPLSKHFFRDGDRMNPKLKKAQVEEFDREAAEFFEWVGRGLADACMRGESAYVRELADAIDKWTKHIPQLDKLRSTLLLICLPHSATFTIRHIQSQLPRHGVKGQVDPRILRRLCRELGIKIEGKPGRPARPTCKRLR
jgi:hypothetical protein